MHRPEHGGGRKTCVTNRYASTSRGWVLFRAWKIMYIKKDVYCWMKLSASRFTSRLKIVLLQEQPTNQESFVCENKGFFSILQSVSSPQLPLQMYHEELSFCQFQRCHSSHQGYTYVTSVRQEKQRGHGYSRPGTNFSFMLSAFMKHPWIYPQNVATIGAHVLQYSIFF